MKVMVLVLAGLAAASATGSYAHPPLVEEDGYQRGSLAVAAIDRGDWKTAEALLNKHDGISANDPGRLINLGRVYMATGRTSMALSAWQLAASARHPYEVELADGRVLSTNQLADELIARYQPVQQASARN